jgi:hypothetical protein
MRMRRIKSQHPNRTIIFEVLSDSPFTGYAARKVSLIAENSAENRENGWVLTSVPPNMCGKTRSASLIFFAVTMI